MDRWRGYLQVREAAQYLGISPGTLRNWERLGKIPGYRHPANNYRLFKREDLDALLQQLDGSRSVSVPRYFDEDQSHRTETDGVNR